MRVDIVSALVGVGLLALSVTSMMAEPDGGEKRGAPSAEEIEIALKLKPSQIPDFSLEPPSIIGHVNSDGFRKQRFDRLVVVLDTSGSMRYWGNNRIRVEVIRALELVCFKYCDYQFLHVFDGDGNKMLYWDRASSEYLSVDVEDVIAEFKYYKHESENYPLKGLELALKSVRSVAPDSSVCAFVIGDECRAANRWSLSRAVASLSSMERVQVNGIEALFYESSSQSIKEERVERFSEKKVWWFVASLRLMSKYSGGRYFSALVYGPETASVVSLKPDETGRIYELFEVDTVPAAERKVRVGRSGYSRYYEDAVFAVVIGTDGRIARSSLLDATNEEFRKRAERVLPKYKFKPATKGGLIVECSMILHLSASPPTFSVVW